MLRIAAHAAGMFLARRLSRSSTAVRVAARVRNLAQVIVGGSLSDGLDPGRNGERRLVDAYGPACRAIVDVGGNVGDWSATVLERAGPEARLVVFEPSTSARRQLEARFAADPRVEIVPAAVADRSGNTTFYEEPHAGETSSLVAREALPEAIPREVAVTTLDEEFERRGLTAVDLLKIDAEGFDLHVLRGAQKSLAAQAVAVVQFEYNRPWLFARSTLGEALRLLESHGYEVRLLRADGLHRFDYEHVREFFAYANFVAFSPAAADRLADLTARGDDYRDPVRDR